MARYDALERRRLNVRKMDLQIAATVLERDATLVTRNVRDFKPRSGPPHPRLVQVAPSVAGLCDVSGRVLGLMPHPERHVLPTQHPAQARLGLEGEGDADGSRLFRNAVGYLGCWVSRIVRGLAGCVCPRRGGRTGAHFAV